MLHPPNPRHGRRVEGGLLSCCTLLTLDMAVGWKEVSSHVAPS